MSNISVIDTINFINNNSKYKTKSRKNEISVMNALMNDNKYNVKTYTNKKGYIGDYYPGKSFKKTICDIVIDITKIPELELKNIMDNYIFTEKQAQEILDFSKEFFNTYVLKTNRGICLGGRENSNVVINYKLIENNFSSKKRNITYETMHIKKQIPNWLKGDDK